jgi:spore maturation protein CgeB
MTGRLRFAIFAHSWTSDWNHGNAHFLRGLAHELMNLGHEVRCYEQVNSWSRKNLQAEGWGIGDFAIQQFEAKFPDLGVRFYNLDENVGNYLAAELKNVDIVLVHEWNAPELVNTIAALKDTLRFTALFHDTHHRAYTSPQEILEFDLAHYDGVLAFGDAIRRIYVEGFGIPRAWTFHEAADSAHFQPLDARKNTDVIWVGNWGDEERTKELEEFLIGPALKLGVRFAVHGVRYPKKAQARLAEARIEYRGYLPNLQAPQDYAQSFLTLHVPRRFYTNGLSGVPTIRVFEALACGIPLLCSPWTDTEGLFTAGQDYVCVPNGEAMASEIRHFLSDDKAREQMADHGLQTIRNRHTCAHRAQQLLEICEELGK